MKKRPLDLIAYGGSLHLKMGDVLCTKWALQCSGHNRSPVGCVAAPTDAEGGAAVKAAPLEGRARAVLTYIAAGVALLVALDAVIAVTGAGQ